MTVNDEGYTRLSAKEESAFQIGLGLLVPMGLSFSIVILFILFAHLKTAKKDQENNNKYYFYLIQNSMISVIGTVGFYLCFIFLMNNTFISWDYDDKITTALDGIATLFFVVEKVFLYFSFTFHIQSISNKSFSGLFKLWMAIVVLLFITLCIWVIAADTSSFSPQEVAIAPKRNILILTDSESSYAPLSGIMLLDLIYFIVLCIYYVSSLRDTIKIFNKPNNDGVKGLILMPFSTIIFVLCTVFGAVISPLGYWAAAFIMFTDNMCLFLLSKRGDNAFQGLCGCCCGNCCGKCVYGHQYSGYDKVSNENIDEDDNGGGDTDALI